jgi:hypothetical protein
MSNINNKKYKCDFCDSDFTLKTNLRRHEKYMCRIKMELDKKENEKILYVEKQLGESKQQLSNIEKEYMMIKIESGLTIKQLKEDLDKTKTNSELIIKQLREDQDKMKTESELMIKQLKKQLDTVNKKYEKVSNDLFEILKKDKEYFQENQKASTSTIDKSLDALSYLMKYRKEAPKLQQLTHQNAKDLLTEEKRLYDYLMWHNGEGTLHQYIGDIVLKYIKKDNPDDQSVWNSDVSRLTYLIMDLVDGEQEWKRDPDGALFTEYVITPIVNHLKEYLNGFLEPKQLKKVVESDSSDVEKRDKIMSYSGNIIGTMRTIKSKKFRKNLLLYIGSRVPLQKIMPSNKKKSSKPQKVIKSKKVKK